MKPEEFVIDFKPSKAIEYMVKGLWAKHVHIDMGVFGFYDEMEEKCFGCAATCAIIEAGIEYNPKSIKLIRNHGSEDLIRFEGAIDSLRMGKWKEFLSAFGAYLPEHFIEPEVELRYMKSWNWKLNIDAYAAYGKQLEKLGI